jgi:hypothetical protein
VQSKVEKRKVEEMQLEIPEACSISRVNARDCSHALAPELKAASHLSELPEISLAKASE